MGRKKLNHVQYKRNIHPDFVDSMDKHLNKLKQANNGWIKIESEDDLPKTDKTIDFWFMTNSGSIIINNWNSKFKHKAYGYLRVYSHYQPIIKPDLPLY